MQHNKMITRAYIAGEWRECDKSFAVINPYTQQQLTEVSDCGPDAAGEALEASVEAFTTWRNTTSFERADLLQGWHDLIVERADQLAETMSLEMGKPVREARGEVTGPAAGFVRWYSEEAKRVYGDVIPSHTAGKRLLAVRQPVGPVFGITPWNFPASMVTRKAAPALAAGCTVVLKPAEQSPLTALLLAKLWEEAGGPAGTLQVLPTSAPAEVARVFLDDPRVRKFSFTGSTAVGTQLYEHAARTVKRVSLELGGHAPFIVLDDADIEGAVQQAIIAKYRNNGQSCVAANRIFVASELAGRFEQAFSAAAAALKTGDPLDEATDIGPLVDAQALAKVSKHVQQALANGARLLTGGKSEGLVFEPTALADVREGHLILQEETFGPVAPIVRFTDLDAAVAQANATPYGLAAYVWTNNLSAAIRLVEELDYGIVGVNDGVPATPQAPFGGVKASGLGKEGGRWGLDEYLETKYASIGLL